MPPVKIFWYDGMTSPPPRPAGIPEDEHLGELPRGALGNLPPENRLYDTQSANPPKEPTAEDFAVAGRNGSLFVGDKGFITTGTYGVGTRLVPSDKMKDYKFPAPLLTRSPGHYRDWIRACKGGDPACSNFSVAGPFTEWILLGALSLRYEGKLEWDSAKMRVTNMPEANQHIRPKVRKGWTLG